MMWGVSLSSLCPSLKENDSQHMLVFEWAMALLWGLVKVKVSSSQAFGCLIYSSCPQRSFSYQSLPENISVW